MLAAANALSGDADLIAGTQLKVPEMAASKNDATSFRPYNPGEIVGSTSPGLPYIPPAASNGCGMIIMIVVAVVVSVFAPPLAAVIGPALGVGGAVATGIAAGALAFGAHAVSSAIGSAMGMTTFSWRNSVREGIIAGVTAGLAKTNLGKIGELMFKSRYAQVAAQAVINSTVNKAVNIGASKIAGLPSSFSWKSVALDAFVAVATRPIVEGIADKMVDKGVDLSEGIGKFAINATGAMVSGLIGMGASRALGMKNSQSFGQVFGSALQYATGNYLADVMNPNLNKPLLAGGSVAGGQVSSEQRPIAGNPWSGGNRVLSGPLPDEDAFGRTSTISSTPDGIKTLDTVQVTAGSNGSLYVWNPSTRQWGYGDSVVIDATSGKIMYSKPIPGYAASRTDGYVNQTNGIPGSTKLSAATLALFNAPTQHNKMGAELSAIVANINQGSSGTNSKYHAPLDSPKPYDGLSELGTWGGRAGDGAVLAEQGLLYIAKGDGQKVLGSAWPLHKEHMIKVAAAGEMKTAINVFKSPAGKTATALTTSAGKYGTVLKGVGVVGWGATAIDEGVYLTNTYNNNPDKFGYAVGASVTNVAGGGGAIWLGAQTGAGIGAYFAPWTFGLSIPVGGLIGGIAGHYTYDTYVKPEVKQVWTGVKPDDG